MELNIIRKAMAHKTISLHVLLTVFLVTNYSAITGAAETGKRVSCRIGLSSRFPLPCIKAGCRWKKL